MEYSVSQCRVFDSKQGVYQQGPDGTEVELQDGTLSPPQSLKLSKQLGRTQYALLLLSGARCRLMASSVWRVRDGDRAGQAQRPTRVGLLARFEGRR